MLPHGCKHVMKTQTLPLYSFVILLALGILAGCKKTDNNDNNAQIRERFHGKYAIVSAVSSRAVDVNLDGTASINLLQEIPDLQNSNLELRLRENITPYTFEQSWQNQVFPYNSKPAGYEPGIVPMYANQPSVSLFTINNELNTFNVFRTTNTTDNPNFPLPKLVKVETDGLITVVTERTLYTKAGWVTVSVEVRYKKYTSIT